MNDLATTRVQTRIFCSFRTEGRLYGIDAAHVREVTTHVRITPVPQAPSVVRGLANLRSRIHLIIDARPLLGFSIAACTADSRLIVLKPHLAENFGILVEHGGDIVHASAAQIEESPPPAPGGGDPAADAGSAVHAGVCKLDRELMNIIDPAKLVEVVEALME